ncbi:amidohydrolase family protein [Haloechinothrix sp. LS1_15]|uniref:amidohydrolase family protein n=1 Tax=Haloechinothrix sp. LS1_15 TaxID=2652248 RepID=UPI0029479731|nr:amidohydrolase family protein [Haloechinothrix sp. LS1_15]MDV6012816.1 amidohydrolase family protein [Haloechinothrix sp. LS1_15]
MTESVAGSPQQRALHLRGIVLPEGEQRDLWVSDGTIGFTEISGADTVAGGGYLVPGLADAHCHPGIAEQGGTATLAEARRQAATDLDGGTMLIRDCGVPMDNRPLQRDGQLPRIIRAGRHLALAKRYIPGLGIELDDPELLPQAVAEQAANGDGWVKIVGDWIDRSVGDLAPLWPENVLSEAIDRAHRAGARVTAHVFGEDALEGLVRAGIDCLEHATGLLSAGLVDEVARRGIAVVPTLINIENFPLIADQAAKYPTYAAHMRALNAGVGDMVRAAYEAGVPLYAGTDAGGMIAHGRIVDEIAALHHAGLPSEQALAAASWRAREWLGYRGIVDGAEADLLVFDRDPRRDPDVLRTPARAVLRGMVVR